MIDGRGRALIMDFGLAALGDSVDGAEVRNGTPAYTGSGQHTLAMLTVVQNVNRPVSTNTLPDTADPAKAP
jgi:hypothetical protein